MKYNNLFLAFLMLFSACYASAEPAIFKCLKHRNYTCIDYEASIDQKWYRQKNKHNETPLVVAIKLKDPNLITYLVKHHARVHTEQVLLASKVFFDLEPHHLKDIEYQRNDLEETQRTFAERIIMAAIQNVNDGPSIRDIAPILTLFCDRIHLALLLKDLLSTKILTQHDINILLQEHDDLFLQDVKINADEIATIISSFLKIKNKHNLLLLITKAYNQNQNNRRSPPRFTPTLPAILPSIAQDFTQGLIHKSQTFFANISPALLAREKFLHQPSIQFQNFIEYANKLTDYVTMSIIKPKEPDERERKYIFWNFIYETLLSEGDLNSAFTLAMALNSPAVEKALDAKLFKPVTCTDPNDNFKTYRINFMHSAEHFHLPAIMVHARDLEPIKELRLFVNTDREEVLNDVVVEALTKFARTLYAAHRKLSQRDYQPDIHFAALLDNLINADQFTDFSLEHCSNFKSLRHENGKRAFSFRLPSPRSPRGQ